MTNPMSTHTPSVRPTFTRPPWRAQQPPHSRFQLLPPDGMTPADAARLKVRADPPPALVAALAAVLARLAEQAESQPQ